VITLCSLDGVSIYLGMFNVGLLLCFCQDQYANSLMHDANMNFRVPIHRMVCSYVILSIYRSRLLLGCVELLLFIIYSNVAGL